MNVENSLQGHLYGFYLFLLSHNAWLNVMLFLQDLAIQTAEREGASYILAQDPDSDRFSAAERKQVAFFVMG